MCDCYPCTLERQLAETQAAANKYQATISSLEKQRNTLQCEINELRDDKRFALQEQGLNQRSAAANAMLASEREKVATLERQYRDAVSPAPDPEDAEGIAAETESLAYKVEALRNDAEAQRRQQADIDRSLSIRLQDAHQRIAVLSARLNNQGTAQDLGVMALEQHAARIDKLEGWAARPTRNVIER